MAKSNSTAAPKTPIRRWLLVFYAVPLLGVIAIYGYLLYARSHHLRANQPVLSTTPFLTLNFSNITVSLFTSGNQLHPYGNDVSLEFRDAQGQLTNVGDVTFELSLKMPDMFMHSIGKVLPSSSPGRYHTTIQPQIGGDWTARLAFTNAAGPVETNFPLAIK